jgi:ATP-dependent Clp protease ATP-binding subunit ClpB
VLLDEIEKAHPEVFNLLLQLLDEGRLTDNKGRTVNFKNTIIIMTSNLGSHLIQEKLARVQADDADVERVYDELRRELYDLLRQSVRPEFLNRIDEFILFKLLSAKDIRRIVDLQLAGVAATLRAKEISLEVSEEAKDWLGKLGYDPTLGARPLKRVIQKHVVNRVAEALLAGGINAGDTVSVGLDATGLIEVTKA